MNRNESVITEDIFIQTPTVQSRSLFSPYGLMTQQRSLSDLHLMDTQDEGMYGHPIRRDMGGLAAVSHVEITKHGYSLYFQTIPVWSLGWMAV